MRIWRNKRQPGDLCVEVSATLGLIELLSQSNIPLVYWTSVQRKGILFGALHAKSVAIFMSGLKNDQLFFYLINSAIYCKEIKVKQIGHRILFPTSTALFVEAAKWKINNCHFALWAETISNSVNIRDKKSHQLNYQERVMFIWYLLVIKMMCLLVTSSWQLTNMI